MSLSRTIKPAIAIATVLTLALALPLDVHSQIPTVKGRGKLIEVVELIENLVDNLTSVSVYTVPAGRRLVITDILISNGNSSSVVAQYLLRDGAAATIYITVPARSTFSHTFATGIEFQAGEVVSVRNGQSSGKTDFYLRGYLTAP